MYASLLSNVTATSGAARGFGFSPSPPLAATTLARSQVARPWASRKLQDSRVLLNNIKGLFKITGIL
jgi:hypothetical protein